MRVRDIGRSWIFGDYDRFDWVKKQQFIHHSSNKPHPGRVWQGVQCDGVTAGVVAVILLLYSAL